MPHRLGPATLISALLLLIAFAILGFWIASLPARLQHTAVTAFRASGLEVVATPGQLSFADGGSVFFQNLELQADETPGTVKGKVREVRLTGLWPWQDKELSMDGADLVLSLGPSSKKGTIGAETSGAATGLSRLSISESRFRLVDRQGLAVLAFDDVSGVSRPNVSGFVFSGRALLNSHPISLRIEADDMTRAFGEGSPADILIASSDDRLPFDIQFSGRMRLGPDPGLDGRFSTTSADGLRFLTVFGLPSWLPINGSLAIQGGISSSSESLELNDLTLGRGNLDAKGRLKLSFGEQHHEIDGMFHLPDIVLPHLAGLHPWSEQNLMMTAGKNLKGAVTLQAQTLVIGGARFASPVLTAQTGPDGQSISLKAEEPDGQFVASLSTKEKDVYQLSLNAKSADGAKLQSALIENPFVSGPLSLKAELSGHGTSAIEALSHLAGDVEIGLTESRVTGYAIADLLATEGDGWRSAPGDETKNIRAQLNLRVEDGIAKIDTKDLKLASKTYAVIGEVDILRKALALDVTPTGGKTTGVFGPWASPRFSVNGMGAPSTTPEPPQAEN